MKKRVMLFLGLLTLVTNVFAATSWCNMVYRIKNSSNHNIIIREYSAGGDNPNHLTATPDIYVQGHPQISCMTRNCLRQVVAPGQDFSLGQFQTATYSSAYNKETQIQYVISDSTMPITFYQTDANGNPIYDQSVAVVNFKVDIEPFTLRCRYNVSVTPLIASNVTNKIGVCFMNMSGGSYDPSGLVGYNTWVTYDAMGGQWPGVMQMQYFNNSVPSNSPCTTYPWSPSSPWTQPYSGSK